MTKKSSGLRVLVVDDDMLMRWAIAQTLIANGHTVLQAADGAAALHVLTAPQTQVDAVLLDYRLPDCNDLTLLATVLHLVPACPVILMTAFGSPEVTQGARDLGVHHVLNKPFDMHALEPLLVEACWGTRH